MTEFKCPEKKERLIKFIYLRGEKDKLASETHQFYGLLRALITTTMNS